MFYAISLASLCVCCGLAAFTLYHKLITGLAIPGWTSSIGIASFFGALNALGIGILGEYVVRIYDQVRGRPAFVVARETCNQPHPRSRDTLQSADVGNSADVKEVEVRKQAEELIGIAGVAVDRSGCAGGI